MALRTGPVALYRGRMQLRPRTKVDEGLRPFGDAEKTLSGPADGAKENSGRFRVRFIGRVAGTGEAGRNHQDIAAFDPPAPRMSSGMAAPFLFLRHRRMVSRSGPAHEPLLVQAALFLMVKWSSGAPSFISRAGIQTRGSAPAAETCFCSREHERGKLRPLAPWAVISARRRSAHPLPGKWCRRPGRNTRDIRRTPADRASRSSVPRP